MADRIKNVTVPFGTFSSASYVAVGSSNVDGDLFQLHSTLNAPVWVSVVVKGLREDVFIPSFESKWIPLPINGSLEVKHDGSAPSSGKLILEAYATAGL